MAGLFGGKKSTPAPEVKPPAPMPDEGDPVLQSAERRRRAQMVGRGGRASTILSDEESPRGGGEYSATKLGSR